MSQFRATAPVLPLSDPARAPSLRLAASLSLLTGVFPRLHSSLPLLCCSQHRQVAQGHLLAFSSETVSRCNCYSYKIPHSTSYDSSLYSYSKNHYRESIKTIKDTTHMLLSFPEFTLTWILTGAVLPSPYPMDLVTSSSQLQFRTSSLGPVLPTLPEVLSVSWIRKKAVKLVENQAIYPKIFFVCWSLESPV